LSVRGKAAPRHAAAALRDASARMQMAGNLAMGSKLRRLMAKGKPADRELPGDAAANPLRRIGIVIAGKPEPLAAALQSGKRGARNVWHARRTAAVMKAVAKVAVVS
jgi:hypothetical protein